MIRPALLAAALLLAGPALAQAPAPAPDKTPAKAAPSGAERLAPAFGKTVVSTYPDGRTAKLWLKADGTYQGQGRRGGPSSGRWTVKGDRVCFRQQRPTSIPFSHCAPLPAADAGASWTGKAATGERIRLQIVPGGPPPAASGR
jgi:hypothetical protein